jgi:hypothetical protein
MSVKIKVTVDPSTPVPEGKIFHYETFFLKLSNKTYNGLLLIGQSEGKDFQTVFNEVMRDAITKSEEAANVTKSLERLDN